MYFAGIHELKKRVIEHLQETVGARSLFRDVQIFNHHPTVMERDKINVVVTGSSLSSLKLSPDDFMGVNVGYAVQAQVCDPGKNYVGDFLAWVLDDCRSENVTTPGVYQLTIENVTDIGADLFIDHRGVANQEVLLYNYTGETQIQLDHFPVIEGSFQLFVDRALYPPNDPANFYDINYSTGVVTLNRIPALGSQVRASYSWVGSSTGPYEILKGYSYTDILEGVVLSFSESFGEGDRTAVVILDSPQPSSVTFGGRFQPGLQFTTRAQDTVTAEQVVDALTIHLLSETKQTLIQEGIDLREVNVGGEAADAEDDTAGEWAFTFSMTADFEMEWQVYVPMLRSYSYYTVNLPEDIDLLSATDEELVEASLRFLVEPVGPQLTFPE